MRNIVLVLMTFSVCYAGIIHINFNDSIAAVDIDYNELRNIEFCDSSMVFVQGGEFEMGDHYDRGSTLELPVHSVSVSDFYINKTEITWKEWREVMDTFVGIGKIAGDEYPVNDINWYYILVYCNKRSILEGLEPCYTIYSSTTPEDWGRIPTEMDDPNIPDWDAVVCNWEADGYRLPTEAEWEFAARGGVHNTDDLEYSGCHEEADLTNYAWYSANSGNYSHPVATKLPNQLGIYDMSGNVGEWCWDTYDPDYYSDCYDIGTVYDPTGSSDSGWVGSCILRSGAYSGDSYPCRVSYREILGHIDPYEYCGFRVVRRP
ncbi:MAG: SUMF1/EgtB/PvdO family nonheme iron enzyme [Candidatus Delongbacteria bacterium]|jgi:sulfatase modifying factor 1|nr:SUMF1/EgtB/PvdO family nonheme iron enzyme [Candidatus Delongbacteria bacterium]